MARQGNLIPVYREMGDTGRPLVSAYKKLRGARLFLYVGEREGGEKWGPLQFIWGLNPGFTSFQVQGGRTSHPARRVRKKSWRPAATLSST